MNKKLLKLYRDPVAYCLDSHVALVRKLGERALAKQTARYMALGAANTHKKITVIMTAFNTSSLVLAAVRSVQEQTHQNFELMIIDDASTDDTLNVLLKHCETDPRIKVYHSPVNHGTYWSKNWCLARADGEFVTFHDSDDVSDPLRLQMQLGAMLDSSKTVAATCRWKRVDPEGRTLTIDGQKSRSAIISLMIRRQVVLEKIGYFDVVRIAADSEFHDRIKRVFGHGRTKNMRHVLYTGLLRDESLTRGENGGYEWNASGVDITRTLEGDRALYLEAYKDWHEKNRQDLFIPYPTNTRAFAATTGICGACDDMDIARVEEKSNDRAQR